MSLHLVASPRKVSFWRVYLTPSLITLQLVPWLQELLTKVELKRYCQRLRFNKKQKGKNQERSFLHLNFETLTTPSTTVDIHAEYPCSCGGHIFVATRPKRHDQLKCERPTTIFNSWPHIPLVTVRTSLQATQIPFTTSWMRVRSPCTTRPWSRWPQNSILGKLSISTRQ